MCKADIELLTVREHLDAAEAILRGGISSVFSRRLARENNKFIEGFNDEQPSTFFWLIDANNLYGGIMEKYPLPLNGFELVLDITLEQILETGSDSNVGYIVEVDLEYPPDLHEIHSDFSLAPTKEIIKEDWLSNNQRSFLYNNNIAAESRTKKLIDIFRENQLYFALSHSSIICKVRTESNKSPQSATIQRSQMVKAVNRIEHGKEKVSETNLKRISTNFSLIVLMVKHVRGNEIELM